MIDFQVVYGDLSYYQLSNLHSKNGLICMKSIISFYRFHTKKIVELYIE